MNRRNQTRYTISGITSSVAGERFCFSGYVEDVSRTGIRISNLPKKFDESIASYTCLVEGNGANFKIELEPRWVKNGEYLKEVGFRVLHPSYAWTNFVRKQMPLINHDDVWGNHD